MPDITMCEGWDCPRKNECYRYRAQIGEWQSFFHTPPYIDNGVCEAFWSVLSWQNVRTVAECESRLDYLRKNGIDGSRRKTPPAQPAAHREDAQRRVFGVDTDTGDLVSAPSCDKEG